ncbi:MAG TPA: FliM/FliN family flagellar motor switch protein [bacterium]|nr:FliM/FliN family flagellar motor switch protein [bacterium]
MTGTEPETAQDTPFVTVPLTPAGELGAEFSIVAGIFKKLPDLLKETIGQILDAETDVSEPRMGSFSRDDLVAAIDPTQVCIVHATFTKGIGGASFFVAKSDTARAFIELIPSTPVEGEKEEPSAESLDAFLELANQIYGKVNLILSEVAGGTVSTGALGLFDKESQDLAELVPQGESFCAELNVSAPDKLDGAVLFIYSADSVEQLAAAAESPPEPFSDEITAEAQASEAESAPEAPAPPEAELETDERLKVIMSMEIPIHVRFGETQMYIRDILQLGTGSIIELNKAVDTPVDLVVNEDLVIARGEVVVVESNFAVRITEVKSKTYRIKGLG